MKSLSQSIDPSTLHKTLLSRAQTGAQNKLLRDQANSILRQIPSLIIQARENKKSYAIVNVLSASDIVYPPDHYFGMPLMAESVLRGVAEMVFEVCKDARLKPSLFAHERNVDYLIVQTAPPSELAGGLQRPGLMSSTVLRELIDREVADYEARKQERKLFVEIFAALPDAVQKAHESDSDQRAILVCNLEPQWLTGELTMENVGKLIETIGTNIIRGKLIDLRGLALEVWETCTKAGLNPELLLEESGISIQIPRLSW